MYEYMIGNTFNYLKILDIVYDNKRGYLAKALCNNCGNIKYVSVKGILSGNTKACGCLKHNLHNKLNSYISNKYITVVKLNNADNVWMKCDTVDWDRVKQYPWSFRSNYARATINGKDYCFHNTLPQIQNMIIDHIDRNMLNNLRSNFRYASKKLNSINSNKAPTKSGYRGVYIKNDGSLQVSFNINKKCNFFSGFKTLEEAINFRKSLENKYYNLDFLEKSRDYRKL